MRWILILLFFIFITEIHAQDFSMGVGFGTYIRNNNGMNIVSDSITVIADGSRSMINVYSIFLEYQLVKNIRLRSSLNGMNHLVGFLVYNNKASCQFCDVVKGTVIGALNLNSVNTFEIRIPFKGVVDFFIFGGIRTNINFIREEPDISFRNGTRHQGLAEAINNLDKSIKPIYFNSVFGVQTEWKRFSIILELDKSFNQSITNELYMYGEKYRFINRTNTFTLTGNYKIFPVKEK